MVSARQATATPRINEVVDTYFEIMVVSCERSAKVAIGMARKSPPKLMSEMPGAAPPSPLSGLHGWDRGATGNAHGH